MAREKRLSIRIEADLLEAAHKKAEAEDLTVSQVVRHFLRKWVRDNPPDDGEEAKGTISYVH
jgi:antitoxin component of RelBE/YafQ-DinJ toxin-antitoxin module